MLETFKKHVKENTEPKRNKNRNIPEFYVDEKSGGDQPTSRPDHYMRGLEAANSKKNENVQMKRKNGFFTPAQRLQLQTLKAALSGDNN